MGEREKDDNGICTTGKYERRIVKAGENKKQKTVLMEGKKKKTQGGKTRPATHEKGEDQPWWKRAPRDVL